MSVFPLSCQNFMCFKYVLRYIFASHLVGMFVNYIFKAFSSKPELRNQIRILDLTSKQESSQTPLCAVVNQNEEILIYFEEP